MKKLNFGWELLDIIQQRIKRTLDGEDEIYIDIESVKVRLDGSDVIYTFPFDCGEKHGVARTVIFPDFTMYIRVTEEI